MEDSAQMLWKTLRVACVVGLITAVSAAACGGNSSDPGPVAGRAGNGGGGRGGSGGRAPNAGASGTPTATPVPCGSSVCAGVVVPIQNFVIPGCCANPDTSQCGLDSTVLATFGPTFPEACQPLHQPGDRTAACADSPVTPVEGTTFTIQFPGCCRPTGTCGYDLDSIAGLVPLGLGCVDSAPFLDGGAPVECGDMEPLGAAGQGGAGGAEASGAAGGG